MKSTFTIAALLAVATATSNTSSALNPAQEAAISHPLVFVENKGQITDQLGRRRDDIDFKISSGAMQVFVGDGQLHYQWAVPSQAGRASDFTDFLYRRGKGSQEMQTYRLDVRLVGAANVKAEPAALSVYKEKYYTSYASDLEAAAFQRIVYKNVYPQIDWVLYSRDGKMEYDFVVHPGGNVSDIQLEYNGTTALNIQEDGSLLAVTPFGTVSEAAPYSFQEDGASVSSSFILMGNRLGFNTGNYQGKLTIDPMVSWGTYFGGSGLWEAVNDMAAVDQGGVVMIGHATSANNIATTGAYQNTLSGFEDGFISKFAADGTLLWSTYYGGPDGDEAKSVALDSLGNVYVAGLTTSSSDIATSGAHQSTLGGNTDHFVVKFNSSGSRIFGTYYGGAGNEGGHVAIAVKGNYFYLSGNTMSESAIASPGAHQTLMSSGPDAYLAKFDLNGVRQWSTYYGGAGADGFLTSVAADASGNVFLFGTTSSTTNIATPGAHQTAFNGLSSVEYDHFLVKFNSNGQRQWGTYYGGEQPEEGHFSSRNVQCDALGNVYIAGATYSSNNIASAGSNQNALAGERDVYLAKFNGNGVRQWATYIGGSGEESFPAIHVVNSNLIYLCMATTSADVQVTANALQPTFAGGMMYGDAYLSSFDSAGNPVYASYFGGDGIECTGAVAVDAQGYVYLSGITNSMSGIATSNGHMSSFPGALIWTGFLNRFCFTPSPSHMPLSGPDSVCRFGDATYTAPVIADATAYIWSLPDGWSGTSSTNTISVTTTDMGGAIGLRVVRCGDTSELVSMAVAVRAADPATLTYEDGVLTANGAYTGYSWVKNGQVIPSTNFPSVSISEDGEYQVITVNAFGCTDTSEVFVVEGVHTNELSRLSQAIRIFPNPAQELVHIQSPVSVNVQITTIEGRVLMPANAANSISLQSLSPGMYLVRISTPDGKLLKSEKLIKMR